MNEASQRILPAFNRRSILAGGAMAVAAGVAQLATVPDDAGNPPAFLAKRIPHSFGRWTETAISSAVLPDEDTLAIVRKIYDETLSRTYVASGVPPVMLVIAYGSRQTDALRAHQPEVCYAAQGFQVYPRGSAQVRFHAGVPATLVYATQGARTEPIVYWVTTGGRVTGFGMDFKIEQMRAAFRRQVPDGFLVRASLIGPDEPQSYKTLELFLADFLAATPADLRARLGAQ